MSRQEFLHAKQDAIQRLNKEFITDAFRTHLRTHYHIPEECVYFDITDAKRRIRSATLMPYVESFERMYELSGETDGDSIWILRGMYYKDIVETLLHESLHDSVFVQRQTRTGSQKNLPCDVEHDIMEKVLPHLLI